MGTNFYIRETNEHIGKRSAAGMYCWDCGITLCKGGNGAVHNGCMEHDAFIGCDCGWYKKCPKCGKEPVKESWHNSTAGRELGFNKNKPGKKNGVSTCSSFTWAIESDHLEKNNSIFFSLLFGRKIIVDEYGHKFTLKEFKQVLEECPIQYKMIGKSFS